MKQPVAQKIDFVHQKHNHVRKDPYNWMNKRDSVEVLNHLKSENDYTQAYFNQFSELTEKLMDEFNQRIDPNEVSAPFMLQGKTFQIQNKAGKDYAYIMELSDSAETCFFDENERADKHAFYELADWELSPDNSLLAVSEDVIGRRKYTISVRNNKDQSYLNDVIPDTDGSIVWANDNKTLFYIRKDPQTLREFQVFRHVLGTDPADDVLVYEETNELYYLAIGKTLTDKFILIHAQSSTTSEVQLISADLPDSKPEVFLKRKKGHIYEVSHHPNGFYVLSNLKAANRKVVFYKEIPTSLTDFKPIIEYKKSDLIESLSVFRDFLVTETRTNGLRKINVYNLDGTFRNDLEFKEETYYTGLTVNDDFNTDRLFYAYNSLTTPSTVFEYSVNDQHQTVWFQKKLKDQAFSPDHYQSERIWATANDGSKIPVSLVYKKGTDLKSAPCLLYGYGSYGITIPDTFSSLRISLLNRGFVYAIAHIRGSRYLGEKWYENGKFLKKINTFTDFINAAEYLAMTDYCDPEKIYIQGGSAGGLLMGAVTNMAPYLFKGVVAQVPFVDVVTTMLDDSIPLTVGEYEEWGDPNDPEYYYYMLNYSPYDNVRKMNYPAMYITTGYHDSQVQYWEPMKWVAKLREYRTNELPLLFDCNMDAGHGGGSGRTTERLEVAKEYAFMLNLEGINE